MQSLLHFSFFPLSVFGAGLVKKKSIASRPAVSEPSLHDSGSVLPNEVMNKVKTEVMEPLLHESRSVLPNEVMNKIKTEVMNKIKTEVMIKIKTEVMEPSLHESGSDFPNEVLNKIKTEVMEPSLHESGSDLPNEVMNKIKTEVMEPSQHESRSVLLNEVVNKIKTEVMDYEIEPSTSQLGDTSPEKSDVVVHVYKYETLPAYRNKNLSVPFTNMDFELQTSTSEHVPESPKISGIVKNIEKSYFLQFSSLEISNVITLVGSKTLEVENDESQPTQSNSELFDNLPKLIVWFKNWTVLYQNDFVKFSKEENNSLLVSYCVYRDMSTSLEILGKQVNDHPVLVLFNMKIDSKDDILKSLKILNNLKACMGYQWSCDDEKPPENTVYCNLTQAIHVKTCKLLIERDGRVKRCDNCQKYATMALKNKHYKKRHLKVLTKKELIVKVKRSIMREKYHQKQAKLLRQKYHKLIKELAS